MSLKSKVYTHCQQLLLDKKRVLQQAFHELTEGSKNDNKSTAGDKHETARAMMQLEQEKLSKQLNEIQEQLNELQKITLDNNYNTISKGSFFKTNKGYFYILVALGKIEIENQMVYIISAQSPLAQKLLGLQQGDKTSMNNIEYSIEQIY